MVDLMLRSFRGECMFHPEPLHSELGSPQLAFPEKVPLQSFPIRQFLADSAYYPAAGTDFWPVLALAEHCRTFVFSDYCVPIEDAVKALKRLHPLTLEDVSREALLSGVAWQPENQPGSHRGFPYVRPYALLARFRVGSEDGRRYAGRVNYFFSESQDLDEREVQLLYLGGEGVATYEALYCAHRVAPKVLAILRPGTGFGLNWTDFRATGDSLEAAVMRNRGGLPEALLRDVSERDMGYRWDDLAPGRFFGSKPDDRVISPILEWRGRA